MIPDSLRERWLHLLFLAVIIGRGLYGFFELLMGITIMLTTSVARFTHFLLTEELAEDPNDVIARFIDSAASTYLSSGISFVVVYLIAYGVVKMFLAVGLLRNKLWVYPVAIMLFSLFVVYQLYRFSHTHSAFLFAVTLLDTLAVFLIAHEYYHARKRVLTSPTV